MSSGGVAARPAPGPGDLGRLARVLAAGAALVVFAAAFGVLLSRNPPGWSIVLAASVGLSGVTALAILRYDAAVALGMLFLGVVFVEPAPPDAIFGIVIIVAFVTGRLRIDRAPASVLALTALFLLLNVASMVEATDPAVAARFFAITLYLGIFAVWLSGYVDSERRARLIVRGYLAGALLAALLGTLALFMSFPGADALVLNDRARALFKDPNVYGPFLVPIALIMIEETMQPRLLRSGRLLKLTVLLLLMVGLLFSYSRGAWINFAIGVVVMLGVMALRRGGGRRALATIVVLIVGALGVVAAVSVTGSLDFLQERAQRQGYDTERFEAQRRGIEFGETHVFGIGPGQFEVLAPVVSHNTYVRALGEQGVLGLFTFVALMFATLLIAGRNAALGRDTYGIGSAPLLGAWAGLAVESFFVDTMHWRHLWLVAGLIWAGSMAADRR
jgi:O-antigen ligase